MVLSWSFCGSVMVRVWSKPGFHSSLHCSVFVVAFSADNNVFVFAVFILSQIFALQNTHLFYLKLCVIF